MPLLIIVSIWFSINNQNFLDSDNGECKNCKTLIGYSDCSSCKKVGSDVLCYSCATTYLKSNKKGCIAACTDEATYKFKVAAVKKCAANCYTDDYEAGKTMNDFDTKTCIL